MKLVSIFFTASAENLRVYLKDVKYLYRNQNYKACHAGTK